MLRTLCLRKKPLANSVDGVEYFELEREIDLVVKAQSSFTVAALSGRFLEIKVNIR